MIKQIFDEHKGRYGYRRITFRIKKIEILLNQSIKRYVR
ncbi:hypothetical protein CW304_10455 [Bacillus sp. UFRGS-B20]|nr:hypothetical protein CW304_10455 [Bacillus sp. UFRGS-B20]